MTTRGRSAGTRFVAALFTVAATLAPFASTDIALAAPPDTLVVEGGGWGHAVGMTQYGARAMALAGGTSDQILSHYYTGSIAARVSESGIRRVVWVNLETNRPEVSLTPVVAAAPGSELVASSGTRQVALPIGSVFTVTAVTVPTGTPPKCIVTLDGVRTRQGCRIDIPLDPATGTVVEIAGCSLSDWQNPGGTVSRPCRYDRGILHVRPDPQGELVVSLEIDIEGYLLGISEMPYRWGATGAAAALEAQVVAARTYALRRVGQREAPQDRPDCWCNLYDTSIDQVYVGYGHLLPEWTRAVTATSGVIRSHPSLVVGTRKSPILAVYSSSSAGHTESAERIWGGSAVPYLIGVDDHWSQTTASGNPNIRWRREFSAQQLRDANLGVGTVTGISLARCSPSGFGLGLRVVGTTATKVVSAMAFSLPSPQMISAGMGELPIPGCWPDTVPRRDTMDLRISGITVNDGTSGDASGDGDGRLECGERAELTLQFTARSVAKPELEVYSQVFSSDGSALFNATSWVPAIGVGGTASTTADFDMQVAPTVSGYEWLIVEVIANDGRGNLFQSHRHLTIGCDLPPASATTPSPILFPVVGGGDYGNSWLAPRSEYIHEGVDIYRPKMTPVVAVADGIVADVNWEHDAAYVPPHKCCTVIVRHADGWESWYIHLNNDTPGTDDGLGWGVAPGITRGTPVQAGQIIGWVGDSGNAETTSPHLHFELHNPAGIPVNPYTLLRAATIVTNPICTDPGGCAPPFGIGPGSRGPQVAELQEVLTALGYSPGVIDGVYGSKTTNAVAAFQAGAGLASTGSVDQATWDALITSLGAPAPATVTLPTRVTGIVDYGFESGGTAFSPHAFAASGGSWSISPTVHRGGWYSARFDSTGQTRAAIITTNGAARDPERHRRVVPGNTYSHSAYVRSAPGSLNQMLPQVAFYDASGALIQSFAGTAVTPSTTWRWINVRAVAPAGATYAVFRVQIRNNGFAGLYYVDDLGPAQNP